MVVNRKLCFTEWAKCINFFKLENIYNVADKFIFEVNFRVPMLMYAEIFAF